MHRYASVNVPIFSLACVAYGVALLASSGDAYQAPAFSVAFRFVPRPWWGVAFIAVGVLAVVVLHYLTVFLLASTVATWAAFVFAASVTQPGVPPSASIWSAGIAAALLVSIARRGIRSGPPRR